MSASFVHLHNHGDQGSLLDGAQSARQIAQRVAELGQPAVALTDHGTMYGSFDFYQEANRAGVKPILGIEAYLAPTRRAIREPVFFSGAPGNPADVSRGAYTHMTLLAMNEEGLRNLYRLVSLSNSPEKMYFKPRMDLEMLREFSSGLIATTGCAGSRTSSLLRLGMRREAEAHVEELVSIFRDRLYVEIMDHGVTDEEEDAFDERALNQLLMQVAGDFSLPLLATNDAHYCTPEDAHVHDAMLCLSTNAKLADQKRFRFCGSGYHLKSREEMEQTSLPKAALDETVRLAERVTGYGRMFEKRVLFPTGFAGKSLSDEVVTGTSNRLGVTAREIPQQYLHRAALEVSVIEESGFTDYFFVMQDAINWMKQDGILVGPGRGSAGGSLVSWAMGITDIDPIRFDLLFERFMNPERVALPDIDVDVPDHRRGDLLRYLQSRWGQENIAQIMTLGTIGARAALKDAGRVLGYPYKETEALVSQLPPAVFGAQPPLSSLPEQHEPGAREVVSLASKLEGFNRSAGGHASGIVISPVPLAQVMPTWQSATGAIPMTGWTAGPTEHVGLVKMDFLGLRNLTVIEKTLAWIGKDNAWLQSLPMDDQGAFELLARGESEGVFQLDSDGMKRLLKSVKVSTFDDIAACLALYRPGPMGAKSHEQYAIRKNKRGARQTPDVHPDIDGVLEPLLRRTFGLIVYQEQVMRVLQEVCSWSLGKADIARKAMGKKDHKTLESLKPDMFDSMAKNGYSKEAAQALWDILLPFADYAFNMSHSVGYGIISYWTAYLKAHYPVAYMAALLTSVSDKPDRLPLYLAEVQRMGIQMLPPDVNASEASFTPDGESIRYGLSAIKGFGDSAFAALLENRPYRDMTDFVTRASGTVLNVGVFRALARSGALDTLEAKRVALDDAIDAWTEQEAYRRRRDEPTLLPPSYQVNTFKQELKESVDVYREWEVGTLGVALSQGKVLLVPKRNLEREEWDFLAQILVSVPGSAPVLMRIADKEFDAGFSVDIAALRSKLVSVNLVELLAGGV